MTKFWSKFTALAGSQWSEALTLLLVRVALAGIFWRSGRTKVEEGSWLSVSDTTLFLFEEEYKGVPLPTELAAYMATYAEHLFPILLVLGLATRLSALALIGMTLVIQLFVYPDAWPTHLVWAGPLLYLLARGGGALSLDRALKLP